MGFNYYASMCFKDPGSTGHPGTPTPTSPQPTGTGTLKYHQSTVILNIVIVFLFEVNSLLILILENRQVEEAIKLA